MEVASAGGLLDQCHHQHQSSAFSGGDDASASSSETEQERSSSSPPPPPPPQMGVSPSKVSNNNSQSSKSDDGDDDVVETVAEEPEDLYTPPFEEDYDNQLGFGFDNSVVNDDMEGSCPSTQLDGVEKSDLLLPPPPSEVDETEVEESHPNAEVNGVGVEAEKWTSPPHPPQTGKAEEEEKSTTPPPPTEVVEEKIAKETTSPLPHAEVDEAEIEESESRRPESNEDDKAGHNQSDKCLVDISVINEMEKSPSNTEVDGVEIDKSTSMPPPTLPLPTGVDESGMEASAESHSLPTEELNNEVEDVTKQEEEQDNEDEGDRIVKELLSMHGIELNTSSSSSKTAATAVEEDDDMEEDVTSRNEDEEEGSGDITKELESEILLQDKKEAESDILKELEAEMMVVDGEKQTEDKLDETDDLIAILSSPTKPGSKSSSPPDDEEEESVGVNSPSSKAQENSVVETTKRRSSSTAAVKLMIPRMPSLKAAASPPPPPPLPASVPATDTTTNKSQQKPVYKISANPLVNKFAVQPISLKFGNGKVDKKKIGNVKTSSSSGVESSPTEPLLDQNDTGTVPDPVDESNNNVVVSDKEKSFHAKADANQGSKEEEKVVGNQISETKAASSSPSPESAPSPLLKSAQEKETATDEVFFKNRSPKVMNDNDDDGSVGTTVSAKDSPREKKQELSPETILEAVTPCPPESTSSEKKDVDSVAKKRKPGPKSKKKLEEQISSSVVPSSLETKEVVSLLPQTISETATPCPPEDPSSEKKEVAPIDVDSVAKKRKPGPKSALQKKENKLLEEKESRPVAPSQSSSSETKVESPQTIPEKAASPPPENPSVEEKEVASLDVSTTATAKKKKPGPKSAFQKTDKKLEQESSSSVAQSTSLETKATSTPVEIPSAEEQKEVAPLDVGSGITKKRKPGPKSKKKLEEHEESSPVAQSLLETKAVLPQTASVKAASPPPENDLVKQADTEPLPSTEVPPLDVGSVFAKKKRIGPKSALLKKDSEESSLVVQSSLEAKAVSSPKTASAETPPKPENLSVDQKETNKSEAAQLGAGSIEKKRKPGPKSALLKKDKKLEQEESSLVIAQSSLESKAISSLQNASAETPTTTSQPPPPKPENSSVIQKETSKSEVAPLDVGSAVANKRKHGPKSALKKKENNKNVEAAVLKSNVGNSPGKVEHPISSDLEETITLPPASKDLPEEIVTVLPTKTVSLNLKNRPTVQANNPAVDTEQAPTTSTRNRVPPPPPSALKWDTIKFKKRSLANSNQTPTTATIALPPNLTTYKCLVCGEETFTTYPELQTHRDQSHPNFPFTESNHGMPFGCGICGKPYHLRGDALVCAVLGHKPDSLRKQMFQYACAQCPDQEACRYHSVAALTKHWEMEHGSKFLKENDKTKTDKRKKNNKTDHDIVVDNGPPLPSVIIDEEEAFQVKLPDIPEDNDEVLVVERDLIGRDEDEEDGSQKKKNEPHIHHCTICNAKLNTNYELNNHMQEHTKKVSSKPQHPLYKCNKCTAEFHKLGELRSHFRVHLKKHQKKASLRKIVNRKNDGGEKISSPPATKPLFKGKRGRPRKMMPVLTPFNDGGAEGGEIQQDEDDNKRKRGRPKKISGGNVSMDNTKSPLKTGDDDNNERKKGLRKLADGIRDKIKRTSPQESDKRDKSPANKSDVGSNSTSPTVKSLRLFKCNECSDSNNSKAFTTFRALMTHKRFSHWVRNKNPTTEKANDNAKKKVDPALVSKIKADPGFVRLLDIGVGYVKACKAKKRTRGGSGSFALEEESSNEEVQKSKKKKVDEKVNLIPPQSQQKKLIGSSPIPISSRAAKYECKVCGKRFRKPRILRMHEKSHQAKPPPPPQREMTKPKTAPVSEDEEEKVEVTTPEPKRKPGRPRKDNMQSTATVVSSGVVVSSSLSSVARSFMISPPPRAMKEKESESNSVKQSDNIATKSPGRSARKIKPSGSAEEASSSQRGLPISNQSKEEETISAEKVKPQEKKPTNTKESAPEPEMVTPKKDEEKQPSPSPEKKTSSSSPPKLHWKQRLYNSLENMQDTRRRVNDLSPVKMPPQPPKKKKRGGNKVAAVVKKKPEPVVVEQKRALPKRRGVVVEPEPEPEETVDPTNPHRLREPRIVLTRCDRPSSAAADQGNSSKTDSKKKVDDDDVDKKSRKNQADKVGTKTSTPSSSSPAKCQILMFKKKKRDFVELGQVLSPSAGLGSKATKSKLEKIPTVEMDNHSDEEDVDFEPVGKVKKNRAPDSKAGKAASSSAGNNSVKKNKKSATKDDSDGDFEPVVKKGKNKNGAPAGKKVGKATSVNQSNQEEEEKQSNKSSKKKRPASDDDDDEEDIFEPLPVQKKRKESHEPVASTSTSSSPSSSNTKKTRKGLRQQRLGVTDDGMMVVGGGNKKKLRSDDNHQDTSVGKEDDDRDVSDDEGKKDTPRQRRWGLSAPKKNKIFKRK